VLVPGEAAAEMASSTYVFDPEHPVPPGGLNLTIDAGS